MDFKEKKYVPNPAQSANPLSRLLFLWIFPLFRQGSKKDLTLDDMYNVLPEDVSHDLGNELQKAWDLQCSEAKLKGKQPSLARTFLSVYSIRFFAYGLGIFIDELGVRIAQPIFLRLLIRSFADDEPDRTQQYLYATGVVVTALLHSLVAHPSHFALYHLGMKCRISACSLLYRKVLQLSKAAQVQVSVGQLVNILSNDVNRFDLGLLFIQYVIVAPIQLLAFVYFLWAEFGVSCLTGIGALLFFTPVLLYTGKLYYKFRSKIAGKTDERGRMMNEIIIAMRVIKMYAWEKPFSVLINLARATELKTVRISGSIRGLTSSLHYITSKLIPFFVFLTYVLTDNALTADKVFFATTVFTSIMQSMVATLPLGVAAVGEINVAITRIEKILLLDEQCNHENFVVNAPTENGIESKESSISMKSVGASWNSEKVTLNNLNIELKGDRLVMVVGSVGSGKTSFLHTLIGELPISSGKCVINGLTAYASQEAWIFAGNIRQNVLLGTPFDEQRYKDVVHVCALEEDLKQLPFGDMTIVGERGVTLSGGQKARVSLARSLYQKADIYLMDDPLSAVDSRVSRHIFEKCVKKHLQGYLRILVTHQLQYLPQADHIIVLNEGEVLAEGTYEELVEKGIDFVSLIATESEAESNRKGSVIKAEETENEEGKKSSEGPESQEEKMTGGSVGAKTYWKYFTAPNSPIQLIFIVTLMIVAQGIFSATDYWLSNWTNAEAERSEKEETTNIPTFATIAFEDSMNSQQFFQRQNDTFGTFNTENDDDYFDRNTYIYVYTGLVAALTIVTVSRALMFFRYCMKISIEIHNKMFASVIRAPAKFFDDNPSGRIMNRFTKDLGSTDELLPVACYDFLTIIIQMIGVIVIVIMSNYFIAVPTVFIFIALGLIRGYYVKTARDLKRIESMNKSPMFTHLTATIAGLTTIRSSRAQSLLITQFDAHQDHHSGSWYLFIAGNRWFGLWLEMISVTFLAVVTYSFLIITSSDLTGNVGLAVSSTLGLTGVFQYGMRQSAETENLMTSVERAFEFCKIKPEAPLESTPDKKPSKEWPSKGAIKFQHVFLAYEEHDVLKDLSFEIGGGEKIGIVGRTGAGKSTIIAALFRLTEPRGDILIDNVLITEIGLHDLRKAISIIPQDPVLFSGTMRYNLDPFSQFKDDELWQVLKEVDLKDAVPALDFKVLDGGSNFSVGQRQLVCLARAILRNNKILMMDEATANVDPRTDSFIQQTIRAKFADCTIITIAHRLHSVMDCDRILVLDHGFLKEYDHPHVLLQNSQGLLTAMVQHTGKSSMSNLKQIAAEAYSKHEISTD